MATPTDPPPANSSPTPEPAQQLSLLQRREVEARVVGPLIRGFIEAMGRDPALEVVRRVIVVLARQGGADLAARLGDASIETFARALDAWREGGALEIDLLEQDAARLSFNVTRCRYAELYRSIGLADLGGSLSCQRDFALVEGFNPAIELERTQTIMEGATHCDFRFRTKGSSKQDHSTSIVRDAAIRSTTQDEAGQKPTA